MKRSTLVALILPLPFAALPLLAMLFASAASIGDESAAFEITAPDQSIDVGSEAEPASLGFRIDSESGEGCSGLHFTDG
ncbi:MAG TPA: hypothetical protein QGF35_04620 [Dehalococcoidia bacterium]|nr:hypothetical protein [Dehalococcoidia bacterium]